MSLTHTDSMDFPDSLPPSDLILHHSKQVFQTTSCVRTDVNKFLLVGLY